MMLPGALKVLQHPRSRKQLRKWLNLVDLVGIEPTTSSMPWNESNRKLWTAQCLRVG